MSDAAQKTTALYDEHVRLGAKMVPFGGGSCRCNTAASSTNIKRRETVARQTEGIE